VLAADVHFSSSQQTTISNNSDVTEHGYGIFDASVAYESPRRAWSFAAYIRNINNKLVYTNLNSIGFSPFLPPNLYNSTILPPRTFGVRLNVTF
jgi:outer membrane receptor protein involved in Fe transport